MNFTLTQSTYKTLTGFFSVVGIEADSEGSFNSAILSISSDRSTVWVDAYGGGDMGSFVKQIDELNEACLENGNQRIHQLKGREIGFLDLISQFVDAGNYYAKVDASDVYGFIYALQKIKPFEMRDGRLALPILTKHFNLNGTTPGVVTNIPAQPQPQYDTWATW
ncbi:hypothetical protein ACNAUY_08325 [Acinetobacter tibetensis]|uniref:hypothetical protein n=1 Tax=Acinetobacter tibetensis TaxID=2943497 RepID=UPI003A4DAE13